MRDLLDKTMKENPALFRSIDKSSEGVGLNVRSRKSKQKGEASILPDKNEEKENHPPKANLPPMKNHPFKENKPIPKEEIKQTKGYEDSDGEEKFEEGRAPLKEKGYAQGKPSYLDESSVDSFLLESSINDSDLSQIDFRVQKEKGKFRSFKLFNEDLIHRSPRLHQRAKWYLEQVYKQVSPSPTLPISHRNQIQIQPTMIKTQKMISLSTQGTRASEM